MVGDLEHGIMQGWSLWSASWSHAWRAALQCSKHTQLVCWSCWLKLLQSLTPTGQTGQPLQATPATTKPAYHSVCSVTHSPHSDSEDRRILRRHSFEKTELALHFEH